MANKATTYTSARALLRSEDKNMSSEKSAETGSDAASSSNANSQSNSKPSGNSDLKIEPLRRSESKIAEVGSEDAPVIIESRASSIELYSDSDDSDCEVPVEDEPSDAEANGADDNDEQSEHEYITTLQDDTTREQFDAIIQDAKNEGMTIKNTTFSSLSKFQIKNFTVKTSEQKLQALKSLQSDKIRFCERNQTVRIQPTRRKTHHKKDVPEAAEQEHSRISEDITAVKEDPQAAYIPKASF